jgi:outer membrane biosynthesis protein TonB
MNTGCTLLRFLAVLAVSTAVVSAKNTPVKVEQTVEGQFPASLAFTTITSGEARVMINIDADGKLVDLMVTGYSDPAFAAEATGLLKQWRYTAATVNGEPVGVRIPLRIDFIAKGRVVSLTAMETTNAMTQQMMPTKLIKRVCTADELDHPIEILRSVSPPNPGKADNAVQTSGSTLVDFYVDETGRIRMPVVIETTNERYAQVAVAALNLWQFSSPTRGGKPVAVRVQQKFIFPAES